MVVARQLKRTSGNKIKSAELATLSTTELASVLKTLIIQETDKLASITYMDHISHSASITAVSSLKMVIDIYHHHN